MLLKRIIPCLDVEGGRVVKGVRYVNHVDAGDPVAVARAYDEQQADELTFLDISASFEARRTLLDVVTRTAESVFMPLCVGGGVRGEADIRNLLNAGADKVSVMTAAVEDPALVAAAAQQIGSANLVVAVDARRVRDAKAFGARAAERAQRFGDACECASAPVFEVFTHGGRRATGLCALCFARRKAREGAGEILLTSMDPRRHAQRLRPRTRARRGGRRAGAGGGVGRRRHARKFGGGTRRRARRRSRPSRARREHFSLRRNDGGRCEAAAVGVGNFGARAGVGVII